MANAGLPISRLINVSVNLSPQAASTQNLSNLMILGSTQITYGSTVTDVIDTVERYRTYYSIGDIAADFGTTSPEYLAAALWFEQTPQPTQLLIGKWAKTATPGSLRGGVVSSANQAALLAIPRIHYYCARCIAVTGYACRKNKLPRTARSFMAVRAHASINPSLVTSSTNRWIVY